MKAQRTNPVLNRPAQGQDSREFLKNLEELMKKNTGSFGNMAFDVGSNKPYRVGGRVAPETVETPSFNWSPRQTPEPEIIPQNFESYGDLQQYPEGDILGQMSDNPTAQEMLQAIFNEAWTPQLPSTEQLAERQRQTGEAYPIASMQDGTVKYSDGSIRQQDTSKPPMPIASMADGNVLWSDGYTRQMPPGGLGQYLAGVAGLSQFIFGQDQTVTQQFGNYNPTMGYAGGVHRGTDFRTRDLQQREFYAPETVRIAQIIRAESGSPYGNSVLFETPRGEMIRLSHLSTLGQFQEGQVLNAGDLIGTPGSTGNSTGEHLDVEFYNQNGQLDNPNNFRQNASQYSVANEITGVSPYLQQQSTQTPQPEATTPATNAIQAATQLPQQAGNLINQATEPVRQQAATAINQANPTGNFDLGITERLQGQPEQANQALSNTIANTGQVLGISESGVSEAAKEGGLTGALRQLAGNVIDTASTPLKKIGVPDFGFSEAIAGGATVNTGANFLPANAMETGTQSKVPTRQDYGQVLGSNVENVGQELQAKAGEGVSWLKNAGEGIKNLFQQGVDKLSPKRAIGDQSGSIAQEVGETSQKVMSQPKGDIRDPFFKMGGATAYSKYLSPNADQQKGGALSLDLFSPDFFQNPDNVANVFGSTYMGKDATDKYRQSETNKYPMSSFSPMSYDEQATNYTPLDYGEGSWSSDYRSQVDKYNQENMSRIGAYKGEVDKYNQENQKATEDYNKSISDYLGSIPSVLKSAFSFKDTPKPTSPRLSFGSIKKTESNAPKMSYAATPQMSFNRTAPQAPQMSAPQMSFARNAPQMSMAKPQMSVAPVAPQRPVMQSRPSLDDYLRMGKTREQYYAETGQQGVMDNLKSSGQWNDAGKQMSVGSQQGVTNAINAASAGQSYVSPSGNVIPNYSSANANMTDASTGLPVQGNVAPYPVARLADGRTRYSDGSIR